MSPPPNLIQISWHDTGRHLACYGVPTVHTPALDALAADGVLMENAFACAVVCSPSRGACLTGRYPQSNGMLGLAHGQFKWRLNPDEKHLARLMKDRGYYSVLKGFQHETDPSEVLELGFDCARGHLPAPPVYPVPPCEAIVDEAIDFLSCPEATGPFYMQLGFFETHRPFDFGGCEPEDSLGVTVPLFIVDNAAARADLAHFQGAIRKADAALGRFLEALEKSGLAENTIVAFIPDHGIPHPRAKATLYDPGMEVATIWRWPAGGVRGGRRLSRMVSNVDFVPTAFALAGLEPEANFQGESYADALGDYPGTPEREAVFAEHVPGHERAVRTHTHKYIVRFDGTRTDRSPADLSVGGPPILQGPSNARPVPAAELFDLRADPLERNNLVDEPKGSAALAECKERLKGWMEAVDDPVLRGDLRAPRWAEAMAAIGC